MAGGAGDGALPRGVRSQADFKRVGKRARLYADEPRGRVVYASRNELFFVPVQDFRLPDEAFLLADLNGADKIVAGKECKLMLVPRDKRIEVEFNDLPAGMKREGMQITWTPDASEIGTVSMAVTLKHSDIQRTITFDVDVSHSSVPLPFVPADMAVDDEGKRAVIWEGPQLDRYGRPAATTATGGYRIAVIDLATGKTLAEKTLATPVGRALLVGGNVALWSPNSSPKIEILNRQTLERAKSLVTGGPLQKIDVAGDVLVVQTQTAVEIYSLAKFAQLKTVAAGNNRTFPSRGQATSIFSPHGIYLNNVLYDFKLQPKLLLTSNGLPTLAGATTRNHTELLQLGGADTPLNQQSIGFSGSGSGTSRIATARIPGSNTQLTLDQSQQRVQVSGSTHTWRTRRELSVSATGDRSGRQILVRGNLYSQTASTPGTVKPLLKASATQAYVADGGKLYTWALPAPIDAASTQSAKLRLVPQQSAFTLNDTGKTTLKHQITGGKAPVKFSLLSTYDGLTIDEKTGTLTVDNVRYVERNPENARAANRSCQPRRVIHRHFSQSSGAHDRLGHNADGPPADRRADRYPSSY